MKGNVRHRARYRLAKERIRKLLKADKIDQISVITGDNAKLTVYLIVGKPLIYRGEIAKALRRYIWKKEYPNN